MLPPVLPPSSTGGTMLPPSSSSTLSSTLSSGSPPLKDLVTVFLSSSPRPQDATDAGAIMVHQAILSARRVLGLEGARTVLVFDGRHPRLSQAQWDAYQRKIALVRADPLVSGGLSDGGCVVVEHAEWLHQAHGLRRAMDAVFGNGKENDNDDGGCEGGEGGGTGTSITGRGEERVDSSSTTMSLASPVPAPTPIVFSIQDDTVLFGAIDVAAIVDRLLHDPRVEYVKLYWRSDIGRAVTVSAAAAEGCSSSDREGGSGKEDRNEEEEEEEEDEGGGKERGERNGGSSGSGWMRGLHDGTYETYPGYESFPGTALTPLPPRRRRRRPLPSTTAVATAHQKEDEKGEGEGEGDGGVDDDRGNRDDGGGECGECGDDDSNEEEEEEEVKEEGEEAEEAEERRCCGLFHSTYFWSDRPHFATREHYYRRVWPAIPPDARVVSK